MEIIYTWIGLAPVGYEILWYLVNASFVMMLLSEIISLFKYIASQSLRIGR